MRTRAQKAYERLVLNQEMLCNKEFSPIKCRKCDYYYVVNYSSCDVGRCLKNDIKDWTIYRISKEKKDDGLETLMF